MSTSKKNGSSFSKDEEEWLNLSTRQKKKQKNSETSKKAMKIPLIVFRKYLKERELDEDHLVLSKAKLRFCLS